MWRDRLINSRHINWLCSIIGCGRRQRRLARRNSYSRARDVQLEIFHTDRKRLFGLVITFATISLSIYLNIVCFASLTHRWIICALSPSSIPVILACVCRAIFHQSRQSIAIPLPSIQIQQTFFGEVWNFWVSRWKWG